MSAARGRRAGDPMTEDGGPVAEFELEGVRLWIPDAMLNPKLRRQLKSGRYEGAEAQAVMIHVHPGDRVLELGGGVGYLSALCARETDPSGILCVEANSALIPVIERNLAENGAGAVQLRHGAVISGDPGPGDTVTFHVAGAFWASSLKGRGGPRETRVDVPALSLDALLAEHRPHVLIADVEGAERDFFARPLPKELRCVILELHPNEYPPETIAQLFRRLDGQGFVYAPWGSRGAVVCFARGG